MANLSRVWVSLLLIGLVAAGAIATRRIQVEQANRTVQLVAEWNDIRNLTFAYNASHPGGALLPAQVLHALGNKGLTGLAVNETTLGELRDTGRLFLERDPEAPASRLVVPNHALATQIVTYLNAKCGREIATLTVPPSSDPAIIHLREGVETLKNIGVGYPPEAMAAAKEAGIPAIGRTGSYPALSPRAAQWLLAQMAQQGIRSVVFTGTEVLGQKELLPVVANSMRSHNLNFGFVEFGKQNGDVALAKLMRGRVLRVHSITDGEMAQLTPPTASDRFVKAARERNIRIAYVRLFLQPNGDPVALNGRYLASIVRGLDRVGYSVGVAEPGPALYAGRVLLVLAGMGVVAGVVLLLSRLLALPAGAQIALFLLGVLASTGLLVLPPTLNHARKLLALVAAFTFPTLALLRYGNPASRNAAGPVPALAPVAAFLRMSAVTVAGGLLIAGLLGDTRFLLKYDQFSGIKLAHVLPLFILAAVMGAGLFAPASDWRNRLSSAGENVRRLFAEPVYLWQIAGMVAAMVLVMMLLMRSGNEPGVGVSSLELKFRAIMDRVLFVRPRTKEFLIGHPAMLVALWAGMAGWRRLWAPALLVGAIGQVSLLNTFCHIHTPLALSLLRSVNGLVLGTILGLVAIWVLRRIAASVAPIGAGAVPTRGSKKEAKR